MSNIEHLLENAIAYLEEGKTYEDFANAWHNQYMSTTCSTTLSDIWSMAIYVVYTFKPNLMEE